MNNKKGFTLIELMIVIAIIGILAAIAIPNFVEYRNKSFCSRAESDANNVVAAIADYFSIPSHITVPSGDPETVRANGGLGVILSGKVGQDKNTGTVGGNMTVITVTITDGSGRCPLTYRQRMYAVPASFSDGWNPDNTLTHLKYFGFR
jgi:type IV pilus assembly protein PilA